MENLCDHPTFTGYSVDGGYAEYPLSYEFDATQVVPLLCAGITR